MEPFLPCPHLPNAPAEMDWRNLHQHGADRGGAFYFSALTYGQHLWQRGLAARAILSVDRALLSELRGDETELTTWPLPYRALVWIYKKSPPEALVGNLRFHYQHLAARLRGARTAQRSARAWACWALVRAALPELPADPRHNIIEPTHDWISQQLSIHGIEGETELWKNALTQAAHENR